MPPVDCQEDYYSVLGVPPDADSERIRSAYRDKARRLHPDSGPGDTSFFRGVQEAYKVLRDVTLRRSYDRQRQARGLNNPAPFKLSLFQNAKALPIIDATQMLYVMLDVRARDDLQNVRRRLNLALVIDCSTSMRGVRMQNVKIAAQDLLKSLRADDRLAIISFSDRAEVLVPSDYARNTRVFSAAIAALSPGGGTEIYRGLLAGIEQVRAGAADDSINHVILLTDGRTYGDEELALNEARRAGIQSIGISGLGIGEDWNDVFLDQLARYGGGVAQYIHSPSQVRVVLREQIQGLGSLVAQKLRLRVNVASGMRLRAVQRATPYMEILKFDDDAAVSLGSLTITEPVSAVIEVLIAPHQHAGENRVLRLELEADDVVNATPVVVRRDISVKFAHHAESEPVPPRLLNALQRLSVFQLQEHAWSALESGSQKQATRYLEAAATQLFNMGYRELGQVAMLEVGRLSQGGDPTSTGRKKLRYGTRALSIPTAKFGGKDDLQRQ